MTELVFTISTLEFAKKICCFLLEFVILDSSTRCVENSFSLNSETAVIKMFEIFRDKLYIHIYVGEVNDNGDIENNNKGE